MTALIRLTFIIYIIFASSYDSAMAHEFEEVIHAISHVQSSSEESQSGSSNVDPIIAKNDSRSDSSDKKCPDSDEDHGLHQCHMGHCGYLPQSFSFSKEVQSQSGFSSKISILKSRYLEGLFRPPRHS